MKRKLFCILVFVIVLVFAGCQNKTDVSVTDPPKAVEAPENTEVAIAEPTQEPTQEPTATPTPTLVPVVTREETPASAFGYEIREGEVVLGGLRDESWSLSEIVIPEKIEGYPVTSIGNDAFWNCRSLTSIEMPEGITSIGVAAFYGCSSLTSIEIPEGVTSIGPEAFYHCRSLKSIIVSQGSYAEQWAKDEGYADILVLK